MNMRAPYHTDRFIAQCAAKVLRDFAGDRLLAIEGATLCAEQAEDGDVREHWESVVVCLSAHKEGR